MPLRPFAVALALAGLAVLPASIPPAGAGDDKFANDPKAPLPVRVNQAIDAGVAWLKHPERRFIPGNWSDEVDSDTLYDPNSKADHYVHPTGCTSLALYTLLKSGVPPDDPVIVKGFNWLRTGSSAISKGPGKKQAKAGGTANRIPNGTYEIAVAILALEAKYNPHKREKERESDAKFKMKKGAKLKLGVAIEDVADAAWMKELVAALARRQNRGAGWRYGHDQGQGKFYNGPRGDTDMSATMLSLLALLSAERCGIVQPDAFYVNMLHWTLKMQQPKGDPQKRWDPSLKSDDEERYGGVAVMDEARGWGYISTSGADKENVPTGSMTACGITSVLICSTVLQARESAAYDAALEAKAEKAFYDGVAWLDANWTMDRNVNRDNYHYYYLYCVERVGDLKRVNLLAGHPWYNEGALVLVDQQDPTGAWTKQDTHRPCDILNTCFALLFLNRSTPAITGD